MEWSTACKDWESRIVSGQSLVTCPVLFPDTADHAIDNIFKELRIVDMIGRPKIGEVTRDWVLDISRVFFGSMDDVENTRYIKEFFVLVSKKNTKSTAAAALMLTVLIMNQRESAEYLILAPTVEAANNAFKPARDMIRVDEELDAIFQVQEHIRTITHRTTKAQLKVVAAESDTLSGNKATGILIDELWLFGKKKKAGAMFTEATGGLMSRPEGFVIYLTTQSDEPPSGVFKEKLQYARDVRDGVIEDKQFLPILYEFPQSYIESKSYLEPENYYITNPNLGASVDEDYLIRKIKTAQAGGEESIQQVLAKHLNIEIGLSLRSDRWAGAEFWQKCASPGLDLDTLIQKSEVIDIGIDGGGLDDLLGLCVMGRDSETKCWLVWTHAWAHPSVLERRQSEAPRFRDFEKQGTLTIVEKMGDDVDQVADIVEMIFKADLLDLVGVDPVGIGDILDALEARKVPKEKIIGISQGWKMSGAIKTAERRLAEGTIAHGGTEMMNWCVGNARIEPRANGIIITKQASGTAKIDPLIAMINAVSLMSLNPKSMKSKYQLYVF